VDTTKNQIKTKQKTGGLPPIEDVPGLEKGASSAADAMYKLARGLARNDHFRELVTETIPNNIAEALGSESKWSA
jgi:hypothetical protein